MSEELTSVKGIIDLTPREALDSAQMFLTRHGYRLVHRMDTSLSVQRFQPGKISGGKLVGLSVTALSQPEGGVRLIVKGDDSNGLARRRDKWVEWAENLPKKEPEKRASLMASDPHPADGVSTAEIKYEEPTLEAKGTDGQVELLRDRVRIRRKGLFAKGMGGNHEILYRQLASIKFKSGWSGGYIYFVVRGQEDKTDWPQRQQNDKYQVSFNVNQREQFEEIKRAIEQRMEKTSASPDVPKEQPDDLGRGTGTGREFHGTTVEEAVAAASVALGIKEEELSFAVVDRGSRGFPGAGERHARIKLKVAEHSGEERGSGPSESEEAEEENQKQAGADEEDYHYTPGQVAQLLGKDAYEINQMIYQKKLPVVRVNDYRWIPVQAVENLLPRKSRRRLKKVVKPHQIRVPEKKGPEEEKKPTTDPTRQQGLRGYRSSSSASALEVPVAGREKPEENERKRSTPETSEPKVHNFLKTSEKYAKDAASPSKETGASARRVRELEDEVRALKATLAEKEHWERELQREREGRKQDNLDAQYEIDQLDTQIENQRRNVEALRARLEEERSEKAEIERRVEELQAELDEERLAALSYDLEEERKKRSRREEWTSGLQSRLEEIEAEKQTLEEALSSEKEKTRRLETDKRLLDEVKRLLGVAEAGEPSEPDKDIPSEDVTESYTEEASSELILETPSGQVSFLPPFPLNEQEVELLRLIAREDELTGEQIRKQTGSRRAHAAFEHLIDRLVDEDVKLIEEVPEDRYRFNPAALQND